MNAEAGKARAEVHQSTSSAARVEAAPVQALAALLGSPRASHDADVPLPPLWHWAALARWPDASTTGFDGHPRVGDLLPDVGRPRRMFAGGTVDLLGPLQVGDELCRDLRVVSVESKEGRQGEFTLVRVETTLTVVRTGATAVRETQDLVYRDAAPTAEGGALAPRPAAPLVAAVLERRDGGWAFQTDPTKLMRFSSATANSHRIHYDYPYATQVEGYPDLVVHGPLMTLALAEALRREGRLDHIAKLAHRALRPLFCGQEAHVTIASGDDRSVEAVLRTDRGAHSTLSVVP